MDINNFLWEKSVERGTQADVIDRFLMIVFWQSVLKMRQKFDLLFAQLSFMKQYFIVLSSLLKEILSEIESTEERAQSCR